MSIPTVRLGFKPQLCAWGSNPNCARQRPAAPGKDGLKSLVVALVVVSMLSLVISGRAHGQTPVVTGAPAGGGTPLASSWSGHILSVVQDLSLRGSVLRVSVAGLKGLPVKVSSTGGSWSVVGLTGSKPEYGPYVVEFAAISRGYYIIEPQGLSASFTFFSDMTSYITVEFSREPIPTATPLFAPSPPPSPSPTQLAPTSTPSPTWIPTATPLPPTPQSAVTPVLPTVTPVLPTATPVLPTVTPTLAPPTPIALPVNVGESPTAASLDNSVELATPQTIAIWSGRVTSSTPAQSAVYGAIVVRVLGQAGLTVELKSGGFQVAATTGTKPEYGPFACEFGGLGPGSYTINPQGIDSTVAVKLEPGSLVLVEFTPMVIALTPVPLAVASGTPPVEITPPSWLSPSVRPTGAQPSPSPLTTPSGTQMVTGTVTQSFAVLPPLSKPVWTAQVTERVPGTQNGRLAATVVVRVLGARGLGVALDSGGWRGRAATGSKPEYGDFACEFGGLPAGTYDVIPDGLNLQYQVSLAAGDYVVVDYTYRAPVIPTVPVLVMPAVTPPSPSTPASPSSPKLIWTGRVVSQTVSAESADATIVVLVVGLRDWPVEVKSADGWSVFAPTDVKEGYGGFVAEFVRLAPGNYQVTPRGLKTWVELNVSKGSRTLVQFASQ